MAPGSEGQEKHTLEGTVPSSQVPSWTDHRSSEDSCASYLLGELFSSQEAPSPTQESCTQPRGHRASEKKHLGSERKHARSSSEGAAPPAAPLRQQTLMALPPAYNARAKAILNEISNRASSELTGSTGSLSDYGKQDRRQSTESYESSLAADLRFSSGSLSQPGLRQSIEYEANSLLLPLKLSTPRSCDSNDSFAHCAHDGPSRDASMSSPNLQPATPDQKRQLERSLQDGPLQDAATSMEMLDRIAEVAKVLQNQSPYH